MKCTIVWVVFGDHEIYPGCESLILRDVNTCVYLRQTDEKRAEPRHQRPEGEKKWRKGVAASFLYDPASDFDWLRGRLRNIYF